MTFNSSRLRRLASIVVITGFFTAAGYSSFGCGPTPVPAPYPTVPKNTASVTIIVKDVETGQPIEGASVTLIQGRVVKTIRAGIGGSAFFIDNFREGTVSIEVAAPGYERQDFAGEIVAGYNKEELSLKRRSP